MTNTDGRLLGVIKNYYKPFDFATALMIYGAIQGGSIGVIKHVIEQEKIDIQRYYNGLFPPHNPRRLFGTPLIHAAINNDVEMVKALRIYFDINKPVFLKQHEKIICRTPLNQVVDLGNKYKDMIKFLLDQGANPSFDNSLDSALLRRARGDDTNFFTQRSPNFFLGDIDNREIINMLIEAGVRINAKVYFVENKEGKIEARVEARVYKINNGMMRLSSIAYAFDAGVIIKEDFAGWKRIIPEIVKIEPLNFESRWFALDNLEKRLFPTVQDEAFYEQIQNAKKEIKDQAIKGLTERAKLPFNNSNIANRYRIIAQQMYIEYEDHREEIDSVLKKIYEKFPKIFPDALEALTESSVDEVAIDALLSLRKSGVNIDTPEVREGVIIPGYRQHTDSPHAITQQSLALMDIDTPQPGTGENVTREKERRVSKRQRDSSIPGSRGV